MTLRYGFSRVGERLQGASVQSDSRVTEAPADADLRAQQAQERRRTVGHIAEAGGNFVFDLLDQVFRLGDAEAPMVGEGVFIGLHDEVYQFRAGDPQGSHIIWDGEDLKLSGELVAAGGTFSGELVAVSGTFSTITAGVLQGSNVLLNLDAAGSDAVLSGPEFLFRADGSIVLGNHVAISTSGNAVFTGTIGASAIVVSGQFTASTAIFSGSVGANQGFSFETSGSAFSAARIYKSAGDTVSVNPSSALLSGQEWILANSQSSVDSFIPSDLVIGGDVELDGATVDGTAGSVEEFLVVVVNGNVRKIPLHLVAD